MDGCCPSCYQFFSWEPDTCPQCSHSLVWGGENKNIIDHLEPNCLIHRYEGSDLLEPASVIKEGKVNVKVATKLKEFACPITVPKSKVYAFSQTSLGAIQALRNERTAAIMRYDKLIQSHWQQLKPYYRSS